MLNTGMPRSVVGHAISGGIAAAIVAGMNNQKDFCSNKQAAIKDTIKSGLQGAIISATAIAATNSIGSKNTIRAGLEVVGYVLAGATAAYMLERTMSSSSCSHDVQLSETQCLPKE